MLIFYKHHRNIKPFETLGPICSSGTALLNELGRRISVVTGDAKTIFSQPTSFCDHSALQRNLTPRQFYPPLRLQFLDLWLPGPMFLTLAGFYDLGMEYQIIFLIKEDKDYRVDITAHDTLTIHQS